MSRNAAAKRALVAALRALGHISRRNDAIKLPISAYCRLQNGIKKENREEDAFC
jgi:hypothetical protein